MKRRRRNTREKWVRVVPTTKMTRTQPMAKTTKTTKKNKKRMHRQFKMLSSRCISNSINNNLENLVKTGRKKMLL
jgi:hypothetical protein